MTVKIVEYERFDAAPMVKNSQFFTTVKDGEPCHTFIVNHDYHQTASGMLTEQNDHPANGSEWDYVRTATIDEVTGFIAKREGAVKSWDI